MTYNRLLLLLLLASALLSGCATINPFADKVDANDAPEPANTKQIAEKPNETVKAVDPATLEMQRALDLILAANRYQQSKNENVGSTKAYLLEALRAYQNKELSTALVLINKAKAEPAPLNSAAYVLLGDIHLANWRQSNKDTANVLEANQANEISHFSLAISSYDAALSLNKFNYKAANRRATLYREQGEFQKALALYNQAIEAYPGYAPSYRNRGVLYDLYLGNKRAALMDYNNYSDLLSVQIEYFNEGNKPQSTALQIDNIAQNIEPLKSLQSIDESIANDFGSLDELEKRLKEVQIWQIDLERQVKSLNASDGASTMPHNHIMLGLERYTVNFSVSVIPAKAGISQRSRSCSNTRHDLA